MSKKLKAMLVRMAQEHKAADERCGRKWECSCGACNSVRQFDATTELLNAEIASNEQRAAKPKSTGYVSLLTGRPIKFDDPDHTKCPSCGSYSVISDQPSISRCMKCGWNND